MSSIAIVSQKGGVGKTTVALNLALAFAEHEHRTLLVDLDPQGGVGQSLCRADGELLGLADVWSGRVALSEAILQTKEPGLCILPRGALDAIDVVAFEEMIARDALPALLGSLTDFSRVIFDTPSGLGGVTRAALRAVDFVLVPVQAEPLALRGLGQTLRLIEHVTDEENPRLAYLGCVQTMTNRNNDASLAVTSELWRDFPGVLETAIPRNEIFTRASLSGLPLAFLGGPSPEARRFGLLADEVDGRIAEKEGGRDVIQEARAFL